MASSKMVTILIVALIAAFFVLLLVPSSYVPYSKGPNYAMYENFEGENYGSESQDSPKQKEDEEYAQSSVEMSPPDGESEPKLPKASVDNFEPLLEVPKTIQYGDFRDSDVISKFSQTASSGSHGVSSGVVKCGGGNLCLTPELIQLLKTRGGNASGN